MMISGLACKKLPAEHSHFLTRSDLAKRPWNIVNFTRAAGAQPQPPHHILGLQKRLRIIQVLPTSYVGAFSASSLNGIYPVKTVTTAELQSRKIWKSSSWENKEEIRLSILRALYLIDLKDSFSAEGSWGISLTRQNMQSCLCWLEGILQLW